MHKCKCLRAVDNLRAKGVTDDADWLCMVAHTVVVGHDQSFSK